MVPFELVPQAPAHLLDWPGWSWVGAARAAPERPLNELPLDAVFSTFPPGKEPDVWPTPQQLDDEQGFLLIVVSCIGFLIGLVFAEFIPKRRP